MIVTHKRAFTIQKIFYTMKCQIILKNQSYNLKQKPVFRLIMLDIVGNRCGQL